MQMYHFAQVGRALQDKISCPAGYLKSDIIELINCLTYEIYYYIISTYTYIYDHMEICMNIYGYVYVNKYIYVHIYKSMNMRIYLFNIYIHI
jgi:hypothetical protein